MMCRKTSFALAAFAATLLGGPATLLGQGVTSATDTLRLGDLQGDAVRRDPRARQLQLLSSQTALRLRDIDASRLPAIGANAQAQYQSQVIAIPLRLPNGQSIQSPANDTYDAYLSAQQSLYDPAIKARRGVERAQLAASQASVRSTLFALRQNVNDAFFAAQLQQAQLLEQQAGVTDLEAQLGVARNMVRQGTALPSAAEMLEAELLKRRQAIAQLAANRDADLAVLSDLTGRTVTSVDVLAAPDLGAAVARARATLDTLRARPEYQLFERSRGVLAEQRAALDAAAEPRISAFGRAGYGRPGLDPLSHDFERYWLAGIQVAWTPWNWGTTRRDREALTLQQQIVASDEDAFRERVQRGVTRDLANIDQMERNLASDDTIVTLREQILQETRFRFTEGVITSADYVNRETDLLDARLARAAHRIQLAQARANFLTSIGLEVR